MIILDQSLNRPQYTPMSNRKKKPIQVAELFAGVGGFREAINQLSRELPGDSFKVVWSNQWEPSESKKKGENQFANRVYIAKFKEAGHFADDIHKVTDEDDESIKKVVPRIDMLVGGFPCQDYSVAKPKNVSKGLRGPKGVLWWSIERLLDVRKPDYVLLENVDRLINSPASNRGRDFAVILKGFQELGYAVEWRVVNAGDYGFPQKRRRIFILAYKLKTSQGKALKASAHEPLKVLLVQGVLARSLKCIAAAELLPQIYDLNKFETDVDVKDRYKEGESPFHSAGYMLNGKVQTLKVTAVMEGSPTCLRNLIVKPKDDFYPASPGKFSIPSADVGLWAYAKGRKNEPRRKQAALVAFLKAQVKGEGKVTQLELAEAAKKLPALLALNFEATVVFGGHEEKVRIAREELNFKVASLTRKRANPLRPNLITREEVDSVLEDEAKVRELESHVLSVMADRAISLLAIKDKVQQAIFRKSLVPKVRQAIKALLKENPSEVVKIGEAELTLDRDTVSGASFAYGYKEGGMAFPDPLDAAGRTIITSEGGASVSRFKHVICDDCAKAGKKLPHDCAKEGQLRRLFPRELEAMNGFSEAHSKVCEQLGISDGRRAFFMGNALVVGVVERILKALVS
jgi:DNA (cytosine-5)-methyltransferase 1